AVDKLYQHWATMLIIARDALIEVQEKQKIYADKKKHFCELKEGKMVLVNTTNLMILENLKRTSKKLMPKYVGLFEITEPYHHNEFEGREIPPLPLLLINPNLDTEYEVEEPLKNFENCKQLVDNFERKSGLSLSSSECSKIDYLKRDLCNDHNKHDLYNNRDDRNERDLCNDHNDHNDHNV
ncbi:8712_t:CDS:2, partial [Racocetra persica]